MEFLRRASNPWDQQVMLGIAWDLMWLALAVGIVFVVGHAISVKWFAPKTTPVSGAAAAPSNVQASERVVRHAAPARVFHWLMSLAMFALLITAFVPVIGIQFPWVTIHWIAGIGLLLTVVYHVVHAITREDFRSMVIGAADVQEGARSVRGFFKRLPPSPEKAGKYPLDHKLYHHSVSVVTIGAIATGILMMFRVDTPFWERNPYILSDQLWGVTYVVHGVCGVALITMILAHIYFAIRPEKRWITRSMIKGWITRQEFLAHHDPTRWVVDSSATHVPADATRASTLPGTSPEKQSVS